MSYAYTLRLLTEDGRRLDHVALAPDWTPALEWVRFEGIREGRLRPVTAGLPGVVEPIWDGDAGPPAVAAFRAVVRSEGDGEVCREIPRRYVRRFAHEAAARLIADGVLQAGDTFRWVVEAVPAPAAASPEPEGLSVEEVVQPLAPAEASLGAFLRDAVPSGPDEPAGRVPVFVPRAVLDEAMEAARRAGDAETGGVLVGKLCSDRTGAGLGLFLEVTTQIPAWHARPQSAKLTFTGETWAAVHAALALRGRDERMLGWWHSHPDFCRLRSCPVERRARCTAADPFLSAEDVHLHATCFPAAYHVALLVSDSTAAGGMTCSLFGWWEGIVASRGFHVVQRTGGRRDATHAPAGW